MSADQCGEESVAPRGRTVALLQVGESLCIYLITLGRQLPVVAGKRQELLECKRQERRTWWGGKEQAIDAIDWTGSTNNFLEGKPMVLNKKAIVIAIHALLYAGVASAQDTASGSADAATLDAVTVTGSHIKGAQVSGVGPVSVISAEEIKASGAASVEVLLQRMPASAGFAGNQTNSYWTSDGWGTAQVNLRGIGVTRTLVLMNGRRIVNGGTGANNAVDLNMIPISMIERIEVLKDGASALYGADAVAGVVNIITKKGFEGSELGLKYGETSRGDGEDMSADFTYGTRGERGSMMFGVSWSEGGDVPMASRAPCGMGVVNGELICTGSSSTPGGRALLADGTMVNFNQVPGRDGDFYEPYSSRVHNVNVNTALNAVNPIKRYSVSTLGNYDVTDNVNLFTEFLYSNRKSNQLATPGSLGQFRPMVIAADHPTNPTGQRLTLVRRRLDEGGPRIAYQDVDTVRGVVGLQGAFADYWSWSAAVNYGRSTALSGFSNVANLDRVDATLDTSRCSPVQGAAIPCADYLGYGDVTQDVVDYILFSTRDAGGNRMLSFVADVSGQLFDLPAGPMGFASGIEVRKENGWSYPDSLTVLGVSNSNRAQNIRGEYQAKEAFAELSVPILSDAAFAESLAFNVAARYSDYDLFGSDTNYKAGLDWTVVPSLKFRATKSTAFRIPSISQLFGGISTGNLTTSDPCSGWSSLPSSSVVRQNCASSGVPVGYVQPSNSVLTTTGGNINLKPEDADTFSAGLVWTPGFVNGLTTTVDYYKIEIENAIRSVAGSTKLALCYNSAGMSHPFCDGRNFTRNSITGEIDFLSSQPVNAASEVVSGIDLGVIYEFQMAGLQASLQTEISYLKEYSIVPYQGGSLIEYAGYTTGGSGGYPEWRAFNTLSAAKGPWSGSWSVQYIGKVDDINAARGTIGDHAPSIFYHYLQGKYDIGKNMDVSLGVDNVFDKKAPFVQSYTDANTDTMTYDLLGRRWNVRFGYRW